MVAEVYRATRGVTQRPCHLLPVERGGAVPGRRSSNCHAWGSPAIIKRVARLATAAVCAVPLWDPAAVSSARRNQKWFSESEEPGKNGFASATKATVASVGRS